MSILTSVCGNREQKWEKKKKRGQGTKCLQTAYGHKSSECQQGILQDSPHFAYSLFLALLHLHCMRLPSALPISPSPQFWITHSGLWDLLICLGPRLRHNKKHLVQSEDLESLLVSKQGAVQLTCVTPHGHPCGGHHSVCTGHSLRPTLHPPWMEVYTEVKLTTEFSIM